MSSLTNRSIGSQPQIAVGTPVSRVDGRLKVTGGATYAADHVIDGVVHAVVVDAHVGRVRITGVDSGEAAAQPGVLRVISHLDAPRLPYLDNSGSNNPPGTRLRVFQDDRVRFFGQPVAWSVKEMTLELLPGRLCPDHRTAVDDIDQTPR